GRGAAATEQGDVADFEFERVQHDGVGRLQRLEIDFRRADGRARIEVGLDAQGVMPRRKSLGQLPGGFRKGENILGPGRQKTPEGKAECEDGPQSWEVAHGPSVPRPGGKSTDPRRTRRSGSTPSPATGAPPGRLWVHVLGRT